jgi:hypothetical protein
VNWDTANFKLDRITAVRCTDEPGIDPENPRAGFDTVEGTGTGTCRNKRGTGSGTSQIRFRFTDQGEPGRNRDTASVDITGFCTWSSSGTLTPGGNHQAHGPNDPKPTTGSPQPSASASPKKGGKG